MSSLFAPIQIIRPETIEFGCGTIAAVARFAKARGAERPLVIADAFNAARVDTLSLPGKVGVFGEVKPEPDIPNLEKALTFLDDRLLASTSNAVERSNRRHRKMQKTVYRVRTRATISGRIALDMFREAQGPSREQTMKALHHARRR